MSFLSAKCNHCSTEKIKLNVRDIYQFKGDIYYAFLTCEGCNSPTVIRAERKRQYISSSRTHTQPVPFSSTDNTELSSKFNSITTVNSFNKSNYKCPEYVPKNIKNCLDEAIRCFDVNCYIACSSMLRLCLDLTTKNLLAQIQEKKIDKLFNRIKHLIENNIIPSDLEDLSHNIRLDGNDAAHDGTTSLNEAIDLIEFTILLLERVYTNKEKVRLSAERRKQRNSQNA